MDKKKIIIFSIFGFIALGIIFIPGYLRIKRLIRKNLELELQIEEARRTNRELREELKRLKNDPVYLERVARQKLGLAREGEVIYKVVPPQQNQ